MGCCIGSVPLDHTPLWIDRNRHNDLSNEVVVAIDGNEIVQANDRGRHYPITLQSTKGTGWIKGSTVTALRALSSVAGACYTLTLNGTAYTVRFRNEQSGGSIQMDMVLTLSNPGGDDWWYGTIYLMCVV
jgi:hypothetical protein